MFELLETQLGGERSFGDVGYHNRTIPGALSDWKADGYRVFSTIRNPVDRLVSCWAQCLHQNRRVRETWLKVVPDDTLEAFARWCADNVDLLETPVKARPLALKATPLSIWHRHTYVDTFLKIEEIEEVLPAFLRGPSLEITKLTIPRLNTHERPAVAIDDETQRHINRWAGDDFQYFDYPTHVPPLIVNGKVASINDGSIGAKDDGKIPNGTRSNME